MMLTILMYVVLGIFAVSLYVWMGRCLSCFLSLVLQKALWTLYRERGLSEEEESGNKMLPCKSILCKAARSFGFNKVAKSNIEDCSKSHPRWFKWLQIFMVVLWPLYLILALLILAVELVVRIALLPSRLIKDLREWWT